MKIEDFSCTFSSFFVNHWIGQNHENRMTHFFRFHFIAMAIFLGARIVYAFKRFDFSDWPNCGINFFWLQFLFGTKTRTTNENVLPNT